MASGWTSWQRWLRPLAVSVAARRAVADAGDRSAFARSRRARAATAADGVESEVSAATAPPLTAAHAGPQTICLTLAIWLAPSTIRTDEETEYALDVLTHDGSSRSAAIRQAVLEAASRRERAAEMRRAVLQMDQAA